MKKADLHYYVTSYFRSYLPGQKDLSSNTISGYADAFRLLFKFCEEKKGLRIDRLKISDFDSEVVVACQQGTSGLQHSIPSSGISRKSHPRIWRQYREYLISHIKKQQWLLSHI